jgi:hypothetical protein
MIISRIDIRLKDQGTKMLKDYFLFRNTKIRARRVQKQKDRIQYFWDYNGMQGVYFVL